MQNVVFLSHPPPQKKKKEKILLHCPLVGGSIDISEVA